MRYLNPIKVGDLARPFRGRRRGAPPPPFMLVTEVFERNGESWARLERPDGRTTAWPWRLLERASPPETCAGYDPRRTR